MQNFEFRRVADFLDEFKTIFKRREESVAFHFAFDEREVKIGAQRQRLFVNLRAAADEKFERGSGGIESQKIFNDAQIQRGRAANLRQFKLVRLLGNMRLAAADPGLAEDFR